MVRPTLLHQLLAVFDIKEKAMNLMIIKSKILFNRRSNNPNNNQSYNPNNMYNSSIVEPNSSTINWSLSFISYYPPKSIPPNPYFVLAFLSFNRAINVCLFVCSPTFLQSNDHPKRANINLKNSGRVFSKPFLKIFIPPIFNQKIIIILSIFLNTPNNAPIYLEENILI